MSITVRKVTPAIGAEADTDEKRWECRPKAVARS